YEAEEVLARLVDKSLFWEIFPERGREMIVGIGRVSGLYMGFVINRQGLIDDVEHRGAKKPAGILYKEGIAKVAAFSRACDAAGDPAERAKIETGMKETEARIEGDMDPYKAASQMDTDEIVGVGELRGWLETFAEASYQSIGYRTVKNPRIWSLHDLAALAEP